MCTADLYINISLSFCGRAVEQVVCCRLSPLQASLYKALINSKSTQNALAKSSNGKVALSSLSSIMHLKKLCNRTYDTLLPVVKSFFQLLPLKFNT
jgi:SNF2 family DNA or RNA helicase